MDFSLLGNYKIKIPGWKVNNVPTIIFGYKTAY